MTKSYKSGFCCGLANREYLNPYLQHTDNFESYFVGYLKGKMDRAMNKINITWREI